jgi:hypothetical protein
MTAPLLDLARSAPKAARGERPITTWREDLITTAIAFWPITALFFDARGHNNWTGQESFFSTAHLFLYGGLTILGLWIGMLVTKYQLAAGVDPRKTLLPDLKAIPVGYGVAIIGLLVLGIGGPVDLIWHTAYGFEVSVAAIVSPPHLALFFGGLLVSSTGIRSMWAKADLAPDFKTFLPVLLSSILFIAIAGFITMYVSAFNMNVAPTSGFINDLARFKDVHDDQSIALDAGLTGYGDDRWPYLYFSTMHGIASMVITTLILLGPMLLNARRWRMPFGSATIIFLAYGLLMSIMSEYRDAVLLLPLVIAGLAMDLLIQRLGQARADRRVSLGGIRILGTGTAAALWISYYAVLALDKGIGWGPSVWVGAVIVGIMTGFGVAFLVAPPAYGPRLVEAEE